MKTYLTQLLLFTFALVCTLTVDAQVIDRQLLFWENRTIDIGTVLEENGKVEVEFFGLNQTDSLIIINDVQTDCGCAVASFSQDTIYQNKVGSVRVSFDPDHRGGAFTKLIIVRTNQDIYGDSIYLQGYNIPLPEDLISAYPHQVNDVGFRLPAVNMGNVYTHEAKRKLIEIYNFGGVELKLDTVAPRAQDEFLKLRSIPEVIAPDQRGLIEVYYNGYNRGDLGFVSDDLILDFEGKSEPVKLKILANIFEYFEPVTKDREQIVPRLGIQDIEIDLKEIRANQSINRRVKLTNQGSELLEIRKVISNCDCVEVKIDSMQLLAGETANLEFVFDPKGRRGIDHKQIVIFSNDPINPIRTIVVKSTIK